MNYCFGVDIGGTTIKMGLFQFDGKMVDKWEIKTRTENAGEAILPDVTKAINKKMMEFGLEKQQILGIGLGIPAPVTEDGIVSNTANLGWGYKEVKRELEELRNMVMVTLGTGVGGGVIINGECVIGKHGAGGEIGHICVNYEETEPCGCGNRGCLEQYASATGIVRLARKRLAQDEEPSLLRDVTELSAKEVFDAVKKDDKAAIEVAKEFGKYLGYALANLAAACDPAVIVIGGGVSRAGEILFDYIEGPFKERAFFANRETQFALAQLGNDAGICGAAKMILK